MDNEQVIITAGQETETTETSTVEEKKDEWKAPTKDEYEKTLQSERSKAKYALLQELGIKSVDDFKTKYSAYEAAIQESETLKTNNTNYQTEIQNLKEEIVIRDLNVNPEFKEDFLTLTRSRITADKDFKTAGAEVLEKNPNWQVSREPARMGTEKSEQQPSTSSLSKKYPWIK